MYWEVSVWMLITLQSYNRLIPKNCENRHFDVEAEVVPFCPMSHRWDKWDKVGQVGQNGTKWDKWDKVGQVGQMGQADTALSPTPFSRFLLQKIW